VTGADVAVENAVRALLTEALGFSVVGEERGGEVSAANLCHQRREPHHRDRGRQVEGRAPGVCQSPRREAACRTSTGVRGGSGRTRSSAAPTADSTRNCSRSRSDSAIEGARLCPGAASEVPEGVGGRRAPMSSFSSGIERPELVGVDHRPAELPEGLDAQTVTSLASASVDARKVGVRLAPFAFTAVEDDPDVARIPEQPTQLVVPIQAPAGDDEDEHVRDATSDVPARQRRTWARGRRSAQQVEDHAPL
jgi:hypothetical protein